GGTTIADASGRGRDGNLRNTEPTDWTDGIVGRAIDFDGVDEYGTLEVLEPVTELTHSMWIRTTTDNSGFFSITFPEQGGNHDRHLYLNNGNLGSRIWNNEVIVSTGGPNLTDGRWHQVTRVLGASVGGQRLYIDGMEVAGGVKTTSDFNWNTHLQIGYSLDGAVDYFDGQMDEVRVSHRTRSPAYIWASWYNVVSNDAFLCWDPVIVPTGMTDLVMTKSASTNLLDIGTNLTYTLNVTNMGTQAVNGVVVTDTLPTEVRFLMATPNPVETNGNRYGFNIGTLGAGSNVLITLLVNVTSAVPGVITNSALVVSSASELDLLNNVDIAVTTLPDSDGDGVANPADPDDDNDNMSDVAEEIANTDPLDPMSFLWVAIDDSGTTDVRRLTFLSALGRTYHIEAATNLYTGPWWVVRSNIAGSGSLTTMADTNSMDRVYYRIGVTSP
ncbi:MAG: LamG-like jellyroll fold domain-containing protein, partial [Verrucomicrobiota bacterium]